MSPGSMHRSLVMGVMNTRLGAVIAPALSGMQSFCVMVTSKYLRLLGSDSQALLFESASGVSNALIPR